MSCVVSLCLTFKKLPHCYHNGCTICHFHQPCMRIPTSQHPYQHLMLSIFFIIAILVAMKWYLTGVLIYIFLLVLSKCAY